MLTAAVLLLYMSLEREDRRSEQGGGWEYPESKGETGWGPRIMCPVGKGSWNPNSWIPREDRAGISESRVRTGDRKSVV